MKKQYYTPKAILVEYNYDANVVASSVYCTGSYWVWQETTPEGLNCSTHRYTDYPQTRSVSSHPCDYTLDGQAFPH